jgi:CarD family transcriptional regulator
MPSVKKTVPSRKTKAAVPEAKSPKQRSSKPARSITASRPSRSKPAAKPTVSKQKAKTASAARTSVAKTSVAKTSATKSAAAKKKTASATASRRTEARAAASVKRSTSAAKTGTAAKRKSESEAVSPKTARTAVRSARTSAATTKSKPAVKQTQKKATKAATAALIKRQEKQVKLAPASTQASRKKAASAISALAKATRSAAGKPENVNMTAVRGAPPVRGPVVANIVSEAVVVLPVGAGSTAGAGESRALALEAVTVTLETSDHQPVTQKIQKKTIATPAPSAELPSSADKVSAAPVQLKQASVKAAAEKNGVAEAKLREAKPPVAPVSETETAVAPAKPKAAVARPGFKTAEFIVYPAHGVGQIIAVEEQEVAGFKLELFVISFAKDKMILKVPVPKATSVGMRKLGSADVVKKALGTLTGRARVKRTMWSRRAQEYEAKINSGDLVAIAEVVRDLYRSEAQPEQSYSERQLYEAALDRVAREIAVVQKITETESLRLIESQLQKGPRRTKAEEAEGDTADADEGDIEEAA